MDKNIDEILNTDTGLTLDKPSGELVDIFFSTAPTAGGSGPIFCIAMASSGDSHGELVWESVEDDLEGYTLNEDLNGIYLDI